MDPSLRQRYLLDDMSLVEDQKIFDKLRTTHVNMMDARPEEIIDWYHRQDPLAEAGMMSYLKYQQARNVGDVIDAAIDNHLRISAFEIGASKLVANVLLADEMKRRSAPDLRTLLEDLYATDLAEQVKNPEAMFSTDDIISASLQIGAGKNCNLEEAKQLFVASEMLFAASTESSSVVEQLQGPEAEKLRKALDRLMMRQVMKLAIDKVEPLAQTDPEARLHFLQATNQYIAIVMADEYYRFGENGFKPVRDEILSFFIESVRKQFLSEHGASSTGLPKGELKGTLHETLWLLDMMMLREIDQLDYYVFPSLTQQDRPLIGRPKLNRGFDFMLIEPNDGTELAFQLKSSAKRRHGHYHPMISVLVEENFVDIDPRRLNRKLLNYSKAIKAGFTGDEALTARQYLLPTAIQASEIYKNEYGQSVEMRANKISSIYGIGLGVTMNRQMRRQMAKAARTKK